MTDASPEACPGGDQPGILIVDDNLANIEAFEAVLPPGLYEPIRARSGDEALRILLNREVALIVLDVKMPSMDGFECARLIRQSPRHRNTPIIFLTAVASDMDFVFKGYSAGGVDYVIKPFEPAVVKAKVAVFVELFQSRQLLTRQIADLKELSTRLQTELAERTSLLERFTREAKGRHTAHHFDGRELDLH
jgi:CheY-like chemotaxis protein